MGHLTLSDLIRGTDFSPDPKSLWALFCFYLDCVFLFFKFLPNQKICVWNCCFLTRQKMMFLSFVHTQVCKCKLHPSKRVVPSDQQDPWGKKKGDVFQILRITSISSIFSQEVYDFVQKQTLEGKSLVVSTPKFKTTIAKVFVLLKSKT